MSDRGFDDAKAIFPKFRLAEVFFEVLLHNIFSGHDAGVSEEIGISLIELIAIVVLLGVNAQAEEIAEEVGIVVEAERRD